MNREPDNLSSYHSMNSSDSPVGKYQPQLLLLAPEGGDDAHSRTLASHFLELGVPIELTDKWLLPTTPPRDLNQYRACLFPQSSKSRYDRDLDAFARNGGFVCELKYYPEEAQVPALDIAFFNSFGRDVYCYTMVQDYLLGGLTLNDPDFLNTLRRRSNGSLLDLYRQLIAKTDAGQSGPLPNWGDRVYTRGCADSVLARLTRDSFWETTSRRFLERLRDSVEKAFADSPDGNFTPRHMGGLQTKGTSTHNPALMGALLMRDGKRLQEPGFTQAGIQIGQAFIRLSHVENDVVYQQRFRGCPVSEAMCGVDLLCWLAAATGEASYQKMAEATFRATIAPCQSDEGLWHHIVYPDRRAAFWSRATHWPVLWGTHALEALPGDSALAEQFRDSLKRTYAALERHQDPKRGLWHLVINEPETRLESSATAGLVYCHDRLGEMGVLEDRFVSMIERAFQGLKTVYYAGGLGASCRGTAFGVPEYYRTRPMGWYEHSLFPGALAQRLSPA
ncbi:MAG: glycoside hydrolase family 88 protein [Verrucomicrobia bacterium]|nr:glycoside hydrolase family 88 protein [Verrucomicrobiota bacterium]